MNDTNIFNYVIPGMRIQMYFKAYAKKAGIPIPAALEEQLKNAS